MSPELTKQLNQKYPKLFMFHNMRSAEYFVFHCGDGWFDLIDTLCDRIQIYVGDNNRDRESLLDAIEKYHVGSQADISPSKIKRHIEDDVPIPEKKEYPEFHSVKEKFGHLNIYVSNNNDDTISEMISLVEDLSRGICEDCGNKGELRSGSWIRTLCDKHYKEDQQRRGNLKAMREKLKAIREKL